MLKKFCAWRAMGWEITQKDTHEAFEHRGPMFAESASTAVAQGETQGAASPKPKSGRARSEPKFPSPPKEIDLTTQILQDTSEGKTTNFILQERQEWKKKEALDVARGMQGAALTSSEAQEEPELEAKRLERIQQAFEHIKQEENERAKTGGVAPMMSV